MRPVNVRELSALGKTAVGVIVTVGALLNVPEIATIMGHLVKTHPHVAFTLGAITTMASLLVNPAVRKILGVTETTETEEGTLTQSTTLTK